MAAWICLLPLLVGIGDTGRRPPPGNDLLLNRTAFAAVALPRSCGAAADNGRLLRLHLAEGLAEVGRPLLWGAAPPAEAVG